MTTITQNWQRLETLIDNVIHPDLAPRYRKLLTALRDDQYDRQDIILGMYRAPASKDRHHSFEGGLVVHLLEMWECWFHMKTMLPKQLSYESHLSDDHALRAIIHHDLNKVHRYVLVAKTEDEPWTVDYYRRDLLDGMMGSTVKSLYFLNQHNIPLDPVMMNALLLAEGGFAKIRPDHDTVFAKMMYLLDEMSANVLDRLHFNRLIDSKAGGLG